MATSSFENQFTSAFRETSDCKGVQLHVGFPSDFPSKGDWLLSLNPSIGDGKISPKSSRWHIMEVDPHKSLSDKRYAEGSLRILKLAAANVCRVVKGEGGEVK